MDVGRKEILEKIGLAVRNAALNGDPIALLEALSQENVLAGLVRSMHGRWHSIDEDDLADIISSAIDELFYKVREGKLISNPMNYLWKIADFKAQAFYRKANNKLVLDDIENELRDPKLDRDKF